MVKHSIKSSLLRSVAMVGLVMAFATLSSPITRAEDKFIIIACDWRGQCCERHHQADHRHTAKK